MYRLRGPGFVKKTEIVSVSLKSWRAGTRPPAAYKTPYLNRGDTRPGEPRAAR
jgi:hypothetical protein